VTVVVGTAGHIDHGKTALLHALTGIDADRLPEEQRRGMTLDVGYAHLDLDDGGSLDFVDVPGHDRLVGNMLVGAGEIDAAMLVVAADDGPRAQTWEHLQLLDALAIADGVAVVTKIDLVDEARALEVSRQVRDALAGTSLADVAVLGVSSVTGAGIDRLRAALLAVRGRVERRPGEQGAAHLAIDRVFSVKGRGTVVTGTLRGGVVRAGDVLRVVPGQGRARVREVQVHGRAVEQGTRGRTALNLGGVDPDELRRGAVLTTDPGVVATDHLLVVLPGGVRVPHDVRVHLGTDAVGARLSRGRWQTAELPDGRGVIGLRLARAVAAAAGDRLALRRPSPAATVGGGIVLDPIPPRGVSLRRSTRGRLLALAERRPDARLDLHGALTGSGGTALAGDVVAALETAAIGAVRRHHEGEAASAGVTATELRSHLERVLRGLVTLDRTSAASVAADVIDRLVAEGRLGRHGDRLADPARAAGPPPALQAAMDRLETLLSVAAPSPLADAARAVGCSPEGVRALEAAGRIVRLEDDLAWATETYRGIEATALGLARDRPLTPAALRDATGTSRRYVMAILDDLNRRGLLRRTPDGHVAGPRASAAMAR
jgi:selenocysteine-specific elongation factor